jgi:hypothetical protein
MSILNAIPGGERWIMIQQLAKAGLDANLFKLFKYAKVKGNVFVFAFIHPLALQEFNLKKEEIKTKMRICWKDNASRIKRLDISFQNLHAMVIPFKSEQEIPKNFSYEYKERATGNFKNCCKDKKLFNAFESIRNTIKEKNET